jgi:hypothetical protein
MATQLNRTLMHTQSVNFAAVVAASTDERPIPPTAVKRHLRALDRADADDLDGMRVWAGASLTCDRGFTGEGGPGR